MGRLPWPWIVAVGAALYFGLVRGYPWGAAIIAGLSLGVLGHGLRRTVRQLTFVAKQHRAPLDLRRSRNAPSPVVAQEGPRPDRERREQQGVGDSATRPADQQQEEPDGGGAAGHPKP